MSDIVNITGCLKNDLVLQLFILNFCRATLFFSKIIYELKKHFLDEEIVVIAGIYYLQCSGLLIG